jgi:REP element-mobilizing transposase RayT
MARPLRIEFPGAIYHVMSRGNQRGAIVRDDADRQRRLDWLRRTVETYGWRLHSFVLMTSHEHLFVETPEANLSAGMQYLNGSYTSYFNRRHRRVGHLFQGRFKGHLVELEGYFLEVSRYLHLNPVRAGLVERPEDWRWGSCAGYCRGGRALGWVTYARVLGEFGREAAEARRAYARFLRAGVVEPPPSPFAAAVGGLVLGSQRFVERVKGRVGSRPADAALPQLAPLRRRPPLEQIAAVAAAHFGQDAATWTPGSRCDDLGRAVAAYLARRCFGYSGKQVAEALGYRSHGGVCGALARVQAGGEALKRKAAELAATLH